MKSGVQSMQRQTAEIKEAMEQAKLRTSLAAIDSYRGTLMLTAS
jgi:hypothetical protein